LTLQAILLGKLKIKCHTDLLIGDFEIIPEIEVLLMNLFLGLAQK
jgi:hypothetical protein